MKYCLIFSIIPSLILADSPQICLENKACYIGSWATTKNDNSYASFQGIRYAQPPVGELRFRPPVPYVANGINDVSGLAYWQCPQINTLGWVMGQEDCLLLNIFVPATAFENEDVSLPGISYLTPRYLIR